MGAGNPYGVGAKQAAEGHTHSHHVHVDEQNYSSVIPAPFRPHAAEMIDGARDGGEGGEKDEEVGAVVRKVREEESDS